MHQSNNVVLEVQDVVTRFLTLDGVVQAVNGVSFRIHKGETLAIVGDSACGKSVTALSIMRLIRPPGEIVSGQAVLLGDDLISKTEEQLQRYRGEQISMIFQNASAALDPMFMIGEQMVETYRSHRRSPGQEATDRSVELLNRVKVTAPKEAMKKYPHEISIGTAQRVMIATALMCDPYVLIADEPTTNLDSISQIEMLALIDEIKAERGLSIILITHDFGVVARMADRIAVMYAGKIVETAKLESILQRPLHPYTVALISSVPRRGQRRQLLYQIGGQPPDATSLPPGCAFAPRCPHAMDACRQGEVPIQRFDDQRWIRCHLGEGVP
jgi:oligopeptide/dipeptide ABC transporter ATP-binding protein